MKIFPTYFLLCLCAVSVSPAEAQSYFSLAPGSKYACLVAGSKTHVVIPNGKGYRISTFPNATADIKDNIKSAVLRRATLRGMRAQLQKQQKLSRANTKNLEKLAKKFGFPVPDPGSAFDVQISALDVGLQAVDGKILALNYELRALGDCKHNKLKKTEQAQRTIGYLDATFFGSPSIFGYSLYVVPDFGSKADSIPWCGQNGDGTYAQVTMVKNPCGGVGDCSQKGYRGYVLTYKVINYRDRDAAIQSATANLLSSTPEALNLVSMPGSGKCSDYNPH